MEIVRASNCTEIWFKHINDMQFVEAYQYSAEPSFSNFQTLLFTPPILQNWSVISRHLAWGFEAGKY